MPSPTRLDNPEQGEMELVSHCPVTIVFPSALPTSRVSSEEFKVNNTTVDHLECRSHILQVAGSTNPKQPPKESKRKIHRQIRFALWFSTYRLVPSVLLQKQIA